MGQVNALGAWGTATGRGAAGVAQPGPSPCVHPRSPRGRNSPTKLTLGRLCHGFDPADLEEKTAPSKEAWPRAAILWEQTPRCSKAPRANPNTPRQRRRGGSPSRGAQRALVEERSKSGCWGVEEQQHGTAFTLLCSPRAAARGRRAEAHQAKPLGSGQGLLQQGRALLMHCSGKAALRAETWRAETRWPQEGALFLIIIFEDNQEKQAAISPAPRLGAKSPWCYLP